VCTNVHVSTSNSNGYILAANRNSDANFYDDVNSNSNIYTKFNANANTYAQTNEYSNS
jgi:hypothetical protein